MRPLTILVIALACVPLWQVAAQRHARIGPTVSSISIEDGSGSSHSYTSFGGSVAFLTGDDGELGIGVARYGDLSSNNCVRQLTFVGLESNYYPVGPKGVAPYASTSVGLARVTDQDVGLLGICSSATPTSEIGLGFGLGVRLNLGAQAMALVEGRFFQVPNSAIQALEGRANISLAFGSPRKTELLNGTLGPAVGILSRLSGPMEGRGPTLGVRFRRDTKKAGSLGLQIDYAPLRVTGWFPGYPDPEYYLRLLFQSDSRTNEGGFSHAPFDALIEQARRERDGRARLELFHEADRMAVAEQVACIPLVYGRNVAYVKPYVDGWWEFGKSSASFADLIVDR